MKRNNTDAPAVPVVVHRFNRLPPISCQRCREKKRRCDRTRPCCSSCSQRGVACEYSGQDQGSDLGSRGNDGHCQLNSDEVLSRLQKLEEAVFSRPTMTISSTYGHDDATAGCTPFSLHSEDLGEDPNRDASITVRLVTQLPPMDQAVKLFDHFVLALNPSHNILHIPSARDTLNKTYKAIQDNEEGPSRANLLLLFSIFAGASIAWTPELLEALAATPENAKAAFKAYAHAAKLVLDGDTSAPIQPRTTALEATATLAHVLSNSDDGFPGRMLELRHRCLVMMRGLQLHRLDTVKSREERSETECNWIEIEVQRRIWWNMVASDWLGGFSGSLMEGIYTFQPRQMNVRIPANIDDEFLSASGETPGLPLSTPTVMSSFLQRLKLADLCRQIVDELPSPVDNYEKPNYSLVVDIDQRLRQYLDELPVFFKLDPASIRQSEKICKERPYIAWQRIMAHFSVHARICHLHRPYHLEGARNPQFHYSRNACTESAYKVLELRRLMDEQSENSAFRPERFWVIMQHVFMASLTLATDVSFNPDAPDAEARKENVMSAYRILERSKRGSSVLVEGLQRNMQTLMETLRPKTSSSAQLPRRLEDTAETRTGFANFNEQSLPDFPVQDGTHSWDLDSANMDQILSEFLAVVPDLDTNQWMSLLGDTDMQFGIA